MRTFFASALAAAAMASDPTSFTDAGQFKIKHPAFLTVSQWEESDPFLLVSSFSGVPGSHGSVQIVSDLQPAVQDGTV